MSLFFIMNTETNHISAGGDVANAFAAIPEARDWLVGILKQHDVEITFTKKDGSTRVMKCTLDETKIPATEKKTERVKTVNEDVLPVYDLDAKGWRSFRLDSITHVNFTL